MARELNIIHTADWHLGSSLRGSAPELRLPLIRAQEAMLAELCELCRRHEAKILLLAGDIFDTAEPDVHWIRLLQNALASLAPMRVFISPGNHDPYFSDGLWQDGAWPENVHIFSAEAECLTLELEGFSLEICGRAFGHFSASAALWPPSHLLSPASGPARPTNQRPYRILLLHGEVVGEATASQYNPIRLASPAYEAFDYLALGHVHQAQRLTRSGGTKLAAYPGVAQGRGFDECGRPAMLLGRLSSATAGVNAQWQALPLSSALIFMRLALDISPCETMSELLDALEKAIKLDSGLSAREFKRSCWRIELKGQSQEALAIAPDFIAEQLRARGCAYVRLYDHTELGQDDFALGDQAGFAGLLYKRYRGQMAANEGRKSLEFSPELLTKALHYALAAHDGRLSEERLVRGLGAYQEYVEGAAE